MYVWVCTHVRVFVHTRVSRCMCECFRVCACVHVCVCERVHVCLCTHVQVFVHTHVSTCMCECFHVCVHVCVHERVLARGRHEVTLGLWRDFPQ